MFGSVPLPPTSGGAVTHSGGGGAELPSAGVAGLGNAQHGIFGQSTTGHGVFGQSKASRGVGGISESDIGVFGISATGFGVVGRGGKAAGRFEGDVEVTGNSNMFSPTSDITLGDVAEGFGTQHSEIIEPGTVVVLDQDGLVRAADEAYDKKAVGVISGAGNYRPAIVLDKQSSQASCLPVALMGKVCCKVDAQYSPIEVGDLLTTSPTPGHAMKAADPFSAFGAVIGKAFRPFGAERLDSYLGRSTVTGP